MGSRPKNLSTFALVVDMAKQLSRAAVAILVVGFALGGFFTWRAITTSPKQPQPIRSGVVHMDREGVTVYSSYQVPNARCTAKDSAGADIPLVPPAEPVMYTLNSISWYVVARSVEAVPPGDYTISCAADAVTTYAAGPRATLSSYQATLFAAMGFPGLAIFLTSTVPAISKVARGRRRR
jgi:hypothetical protein